MPAARLQLSEICINLWQGPFSLEHLKLLAEDDIISPDSVVLHAVHGPSLLRSVLAMPAAQGHTNGVQQAVPGNSLPAASHRCHSLGSFLQIQFTCPENNNNVGCSIPMFYILQDMNRKINPPWNVHTSPCLYMHRLGRFVKCTGLVLSVKS